MGLFKRDREKPSPTQYPELYDFSLAERLMWGAEALRELEGEHWLVPHLIKIMDNAATMAWSFAVGNHDTADPYNPNTQAYRNSRIESVYRTELQLVDELEARR